MRCFVAAFVEVDSARRLATAYRHWRPMPDHARRVPLANYHVTLRFLGELDAAGVSRVLSAVSALGDAACSARVIGFGGLPRAGAARVLVAELAAHEMLTAWWRRLAAELGPGEATLHPHVTLARLRGRRAVDARPPDSPLALALEPPRLYRSDRAAGGVRYRPVTAADLSPGP